MTFHKLQILLTPDASTDSIHFRDAVIRAVEYIDKHKAADLKLRAGFKLDANPIANLPHSEANAAESDSKINDALIELFSAERSVTDAAIPLLQKALKTAGSVVDCSRSVVIAGIEHVLLPGWGELQLVFALRRKRTLTRQAFHDYWLHQHVHFALDQADNGLLYRQHHTDSDWSESVASRLGYSIDDFDGCAEVYYQTVEEIAERFSRPDISRDAFADEQTFIDHANSWLGFYRMYQCDQ